MIKFGASAALLFLLFVTANGQTSDEEINRLRSLLKLPASINLITEPISPEITSAKVTKLFIASEQDKKVNNRIGKWVSEWNQQEASKYGQLQLVSTVLEADVILAFRREREMIPQTRTSLGIGSVFDPNRGVSKSRDPQISTKTYFPISRYTYLITRAADDYPTETFQILYGKVDRSHIQDYSDPDKYLFNELKKRLKNR